MIDDTIHALMVDDDEDDYVLTRQQLVGLVRPEIVLDWTSTFDAGREAMRRDRHDIYLVDYRLGARTGLDLVRLAITGGCRKPIIMLTGLDDHRVDIEAMNAGAVDYLVKSEISAPLLERTIRYAIQQKQNERELLEMQQRLADAREEERLHLARELHDGPLQELIGIRFHLAVIGQGQEDSNLPQQLAPVQAQLQNLIDSLRAISRELRPPSLAPFGLEQAIRVHARQFHGLHPDIEIQLDLDADEQSLPERVRLALFRICQNALSNVAQHAEATQVRIRFQLTDDEVHLKITDDGQGFAVPARWIDLARQGSFGILGSSERAESIGGRLIVRSSPELGTVISVTAPRQCNGTASDPSSSPVYVRYRSP